MASSDYKHKRIILFIFIAGLAYRTLAGLQGFDHIDVGFGCTFFQSIFDSPDAFTFNYLFYLTGLIGGCWYNFFPSAGLLGLRFFDNIFILSSIYFLYLILKEKIQFKYLAPAIALSILFPTIINTFNYDTLTFFLITAAALSFHKARQNGYWILYFVSGFAIGLSFMARLVNVTLVSLLIIPLIVFYYNKNKRELCISLPLMLVGMVVGVATVVCIMSVLGHLGPFLNAINDAFGLLGRTDNTHSSSNIIFVYLKSLLNILLNAGVIILIFYLYSHIKIQSAKLTIAIRVILSAALLALVATTPIYMITAAVCLTLTICFFIYFRKDGDAITLISFVTLAALVMPLGSDIGIAGVLHWSMGLLLMPAAYSLQQILDTYVTADKKDKALQFVKICFCFIAIAAFTRTSYKAYGEDSPRILGTKLVKEGTLNVFTDNKKAECYQNAIENIDRYNNKYLLVGNQAAEMYFATRKIPFIDKTSMDQYTETLLKRRLEERTSHFNSHPLIIFIKDLKPDDKIIELRPAIMDYIGKNNYKLAVDNRYIKLYVPEEYK